MAILQIINFIDLFFLLPLFIIGIISSYTDIKYNKIFNSLIILGLLYGLWIIIALLLQNIFLLGEAENFIYIGKVFLNSFLALLVGYFLWYQKYWSAGDAKLFTVYALLLPLKFYDKSYFDYFPSFNLIINLFFPVIIVLSFYSLKDFFYSLFERLIKKNIFLKQVPIKERYFNAIKELKKIGTLLINFIFFIVIIQIILLSFRIVIGQTAGLHPFLLYLIIVFLMQKINKWKNKFRWLTPLIYSVSFIYIFYLIIQLDFSAILGLARMALIFLIFINLARHFLDHYIDRKEIGSLPLKDLRKGVLIHQEDLSKLISSLSTKEKEALNWIGAEGISEEQILIIKNKFKTSLNNEIRFYKTFPFAPYMLLATIISILTQSSFLAWIDII